MPIHFTVDPVARLVVYVVEGNATREEAIEFLDAVLGHSDFCRGFNFLGDRRDVVHSPGSGCIYGVADEVSLRQKPLAPCKWAVIVSNDSAYGMTRMWGILTERTRIEILPFRRAAEATYWLNVDEDHIPLRFVPASQDVVHVGG